MKSGDYLIVSSGTAITFESNPLELGFEGGFLLVLSFVDGSTESKIEAVIHSDKKLELKLHNFNNTLDQGNISPIGIGEVNTKKLYLNFRVRKVGNSRTVDYTIYRDE